MRTKRTNAGWDVFFFQGEDGIREWSVTGGQTCALPICSIVGGEITEYTQLLEEARRHAVDRLVQNATAMGGNAVIMMRFDSAEIGQTMSEIEIVRASCRERV